MHLIHLRPIMLMIVIVLTCAWLGQWYCALRLCVYWGRSKKKSKGLFDEWLILPHVAWILTLPGMAVLTLISYLLKVMGVISGKEETLLRSLLDDCFLTGILLAFVPSIIEAVYLLFGGKEKHKESSEIINPFEGHLNTDETILWLGNPVQPYFGNKKARPVGYVMGIYSIIEVFLAIETTHIWRVHDFYHVVEFTKMLALPFMFYIVFRMIKSDYSSSEHYYAVTNQRLLNANRIRSRYFTRCSLRYEYIDFSKTARVPEAKGIDTLNYSSKVGGWSYMSNDQCKPGVDTDINFRCIEDADTVEALVRVAYEESQKRGCYDAV